MLHFLLIPFIFPCLHIQVCFYDWDWYVIDQIFETELQYFPLFTSSSLF